MTDIPDAARDLALEFVRLGTRLDVCSQLPTNVTEATATYTLGNKTVALGAVEDGATEGRRTRIPAITDGDATGDGTPTHWALTGGGVLRAWGTLNSAMAVANGGQFTLSEISIGLADGVAGGV